eukprot:6191501-Pleurochrysis_carterae.AAC.3
MSHAPCTRARNGRHARTHALTQALVPVQVACPPPTHYARRVTQARPQAPSACGCTRVQPLY